MQLLLKVDQVVSGHAMQINCPSFRHQYQHHAGVK